MRGAIAAAQRRATSHQIFKKQRENTTMPRINPLKVRHLHMALAPIMALPLLLTLVTGSLFQFAELTGQESQFFWLIQLHRGNFGVVNLSKIYPFLNALGLLTLLITGLLMWLRTRRWPRAS